MDGWRSRRREARKKGWMDGMVSDGWMGVKKSQRR